MATERINKATDKVVEYMYREEDRHFREWINEDDKKDSVIFLKKLKEHILYSVVVLKYKGNVKEINEWLQQYWDENGEEEEEEEYEEGEEEPEIKTKCGCRIIRDSKEHDGCVCDDEGENWICENCYKGEYDKEE